MSDTYEKGLGLERLVANLFKAKGYDVEHNVKLTGRSGVQHQIDVYAEYKGPLHTSRIVIECKSYDKPIDKDIIMKLVHEVEDLGVDKGILITTSYFTPDAVSTAEGYNVDLWDGTKLRELLKEVSIEEISVPSNVFYVEPVISAGAATKTVKAAVKGIFGMKGSIESGSIVFYPYYEADIDARTYKFKGLIKKKVEENIVSATILVDATTGALCTYDPKVGIVEVVGLPALSDEEIRVFQMLLLQELTVPALASLLSCSTAKARKILQGLVVKEVAEMLRHERQTFYRARIKVPDPSRLRTLPSNLVVKSGEPKEGVEIKVRLGLEKLEGLVKLLWRGTVRSYKIVFYPYYTCKIVEGGKKYVKVTDMLSNKVDERISKMLTALYPQLPF